jgi:hypothetical protein
MHPWCPPLPVYICNESHQNEYAAIENVADEKKWQDDAKSHTGALDSATLCKNLTRMNFAAIKSLTDEEKWQGYRKNAPWCPPLTVSVMNLTRMNLLPSKAKPTSRSGRDYA